MPPKLKTLYASLPEAFHAKLTPTPVANAQVVALNTALADSLGIDSDWLQSEGGLATLAGNMVLPGTEPLAQAYAGHQFANWVPQLGDGRAHLLGEMETPAGRVMDLQLKGSGRTPFSRGGDGRSSIGPAVREYLASEAMAALGIPTTRALSVISTGEQVMRDRPEPGGVMCRVASSHVRIGTFEYFARNGHGEHVPTLADFVIDRHDPDLADQPDRYRQLFDRVALRTMALVAHWMSVGFVHGVMNTDNVTLSGETLDYGPFGFLDTFDPDTAFSYIDRRGRYAWGRQPTIAHWNLARLAECLLPLFGDDPNEVLEWANERLNQIPADFEAAFHPRLCHKIGLNPSTEGATLAMNLLQSMADNEADMTQTFRALSHLNADADEKDLEARAQFKDPTSFDGWVADWRAALQAEGGDHAERQVAMQGVNPAFILRNHLAQRAADAAVNNLDFQPLHEMLEVFARPFEEQPRNAAYQQPPRADEVVANTFCGT
ncbi:MAG: YdiU family protein [Pseudomonadota bacterium]